MRGVRGEGADRPSPSPSGERDRPQSGQGEGPFRRVTSAENLRRARAARAEMTEAEERLWSALRGRGLGDWKFKRQLPIGNRRPDFSCAKAKLILEVDGSQHFNDAKRDAVRTEILEQQGYRVMRVWNNDVMARLDLVLEAILGELRPHPGASRLSLSPEGEGK